MSTQKRPRSWPEFLASMATRPWKEWLKITVFVVVVIVVARLAGQLAGWL